METWKYIENYEGLYQISNKGRVRNSRSGRILIQKIKNTDSNSYRLIVLSKNNVKKCHYIHRLVAKAFLPNPNNLPCVNHKDENKTNNNKDNLEWCTHKYNSNYGTNPQRLSENAKAKPTWQKAVEKSKIKVKQLTLNNELIKIWDSFADIAREFNIQNASNIVACCKGKKKTSYGYKWSYENI